MLVSLIRDQIISGNKFFDAVERFSHFEGFGRTFKVIKSKNNTTLYLSQKIKKQQKSTLMVVLLNIGRVVFLPITLMAFLFKCLNRMRLKHVTIEDHVNKQQRPYPNEVYANLLRFLPLDNFQQVATAHSVLPNLLAESMRMECMESPTFLEKLNPKKFKEAIPPFEIYKGILMNINNSPLSLFMAFENSVKRIHLPEHKKVVEFLLKERGVQLVKGAQAEWEKYFGKIKDEHAPPMPENIFEILLQKDPYDSKKTVGQNYTFFLVPQEVNGQKLTITSMEEFVKNSKGYKTKYGYYHDDVKTQIGSKPVTKSRWVLMRNDVIPGSMIKSFEDQKALLTKNCEVPRVLDAIVLNFLTYARDGKRLYGNDPWTYTRCHEAIPRDGNNYQTYVGGFAPSGLNVNCDFYVVDVLDLAASWKLD